VGDGRGVRRLASSKSPYCCFFPVVFFFQRGCFFDGCVAVRGPRSRLASTTILGPARDLKSPRSARSSIDGPPTREYFLFLPLSLPLPPCALSYWAGGISKWKKAGYCCLPPHHCRSKESSSSVWLLFPGFTTAGGGS